MGWFDRKKQQPPVGVVQTRRGDSHPFGALEHYVPMGQGEIHMYRAIREAVPMVDAALVKLVRLCGGVKVTCTPAAQKQLDRFLQTVPTGRGLEGVQSFLDCYLDSMLVSGRAVAVSVLAQMGCGLAGLALAGRLQQVNSHISVDLGAIGLALVAAAIYALVATGSLKGAWEKLGHRASELTGGLIGKRNDRE